MDKLYEHIEQALHAHHRFRLDQHYMVDPKSKKVLWQVREQETIDARGMALLRGRLYYYSEGKFLACVDQSIGNVTDNRVEMMGR